MRELLKVLKAAGDKNRLRILKMLQQKDMCVCELAAALGITQPSVSKHMSLLKEAGLVKDERNGQWRNINNTQWPEQVWVLCPTCHALVDRMRYSPEELGLTI